MKPQVYKLIFLLFASWAVNPECGYSQGSVLLRLPALTDVSKVAWHDSIYLLPEFQKGRITYAKGFELDYQFNLNYNVYYEKMHYINSAGDTLEITNTRDIQFVQIGDKSLFHEYNKGYYEVILKLPVALAVRNKLVLESGQYNSGNAVSVTRLEVRGVVTDYDRSYSRGFAYFLIGQNKSLHKATRTSILKLFPSSRDAIQEYLSKNKVNFESREDLVNMLVFCNQLISN